VSLLEAGEVEELGLHREAGLCHDLDLEFIAFPVPNGGVPASTRVTMALAEAVIALLDEGKAGAVQGRRGWRLSYCSRIAEASDSAPAPEHAGGVSFQVSLRGTPTERIWCER
jgi:hypothetical protein